MPALLYLQHQDEIAIEINEDGLLTITQSNSNRDDVSIFISPLYVDDFLNILQTVIKEA